MQYDPSWAEPSTLRANEQEDGRWLCWQSVLPSRTPSPGGWGEATKGHLAWFLGWSRNLQG